MEAREASVILVKCSSGDRTFGIRIEKRGNDWVRTWAFKIDEAKAAREGFDKTRITGSFATDPKYPGCPYCGEKFGLLLCACGKIICWNQNRKSEKCHWCGMLIRGTAVTESFDVSAGHM